MGFFVNMTQATEWTAHRGVAGSECTLSGSEMVRTDLFSYLQSFTIDLITSPVQRLWYRSLPLLQSTSQLTTTLTGPSEVP